MRSSWFYGQIMISAQWKDRQEKRRSGGKENIKSIFLPHHEIFFSGKLLSETVPTTDLVKQNNVLKRPFIFTKIHIQSYVHTSLVKASLMADGQSVIEQ